MFSYNTNIFLNYKVHYIKFVPKYTIDYYVLNI